MGEPRKEMKQLIRRAKMAALASLYALSIGTLVVIHDDQLLLWIAGLLILLAIGYTLLLRTNDVPFFSIFAGVSILLEVMAVVLLSSYPFALSWILLGVGLCAIMIGNHTSRSSAMLQTSSKSTEGEKVFYHAALHGILRIIYLVGLVMVISLVVLLFSLNVRIGALTISIMAICVVLILASLTVLASMRHRET